MQTILVNSQSFLQTNFAFLGEVTTKPHFSGYQSAFKDGVMFALYKEGKLYLRKSSTYMDDIAQTIGSVYFLADPKIKLQAKLFYHFPLSLYPLLVQNPQWILESISEYKAQKDKINQDNQNKIRYMLNLDFKIEKLLNKIDIQTVDQLLTLGEVNIAIKLIEKGFELSPLLMFKIHGAIYRQYIYHFTPQEKQAILKSIDDGLYASGLRRRFTK